MIAVIADDFTGAAEIGGLGLRYGLKTAIRGSINSPGPVVSATTADLLIIAADTRSKDAGAAARHIRELTSGLLRLRPRLLYKKLDSVLRGHILPELAAQMEAMDLQRALIVPANPALGRIISKGVYYIDGKPLHETGFGRDPEFAVRSSNVADMLKRDRHRSGQGSEHDQRHEHGRRHERDQSPVIIGSPDTTLPARGFVIGEASTDRDLKKWAEKIDETTLAAGASGFFSALLDHLGFSTGRSNQTAVHRGNKKLFVCGSSYSESKHIIRDMKTRGLPVSLLPAAMTQPGAGSPELIKQSVSELESAISRYNYAVLSVDLVNEPVAPDARPAAETARTIRENMAHIAAQVMHRTTINELLLEGGATATAVLNKLRLEQLYPEQEIAHGVLRMRVPGNDELSITVKPGSYQWPPAIRSLLH